MLSALSASLGFTGGEAADLARPAVEAAERLSDAPHIWLARDLLSTLPLALLDLSLHLLPLRSGFRYFLLKPVVRPLRLRSLRFEIS